MRQIAVLGLGKFGRTVAKELTDKGAQVIAIDNNKAKIEDIKDSVTYAIGISSIDEEALKEAGIQNVDIAIVCIGEDIESNLLTTLLLKKMGVKKIWARATSPLQEEILKTLEVDNVLNLEVEMGKIISNTMISTNIAKHMPLAPGHSIAEIALPESFVGQSIRKIKPRESYNVNVIAVKRKKPAINDTGERKYEEELIDVPSPDMTLEESDVLLIVGADKDIENFSRQ